MNYNVLIYLGSDVLCKIIPFSILPIATNYLTPSEYGVIFMFVTIQEILQIVVVWGGNTYFKINYFKDKYRVRKIYDNAALISILMSCTLVVVILSLKGFINQSDIGFSLYWLLAIPFICFLQAILLLNLAEFQCEEKAVSFGIVNFIQSLFSSLFFIYFLFIQKGIESRFISIIIGVVSALLVSYVINRRNVNKRVEYQVDYDTLKVIFAFGLSIFPHAVSWWMRSGIDRFIFSNYFGSEYVGLYSLALQLVMPLIMVCNAINQAYIPLIYRSFESGEYKYFINVLIKSLAVMFFVSGFFILIKDIIFSTFIDERYMESSKIIFPLILGALLQFVVIFFSNIFYYYEKGKVLSFITFSSAFIHALFTYALSKFFGFEIALFSYPISFFTTLIFMMLYLAKTVQLNAQ